MMCDKKEKDSKQDESALRLNCCDKTERQIHHKLPFLNKERRLFLFSYTAVCFVAGS